MISEVVIVVVISVRRYSASFSRSARAQTGGVLPVVSGCSSGVNCLGVSRNVVRMVVVSFSVVWLTTGLFLCYLVVWFGVVFLVL